MTKDTPPNVIAHEGLHSLSLAHTFESDKIILQGEKERRKLTAKHSYQIGKTHNLMDYVDKSVYLYRWQWEIAKEHAQHEP